MSVLTNIKHSEGEPKVLQSGKSSLSSSDRLARNLGWFSIGLGLVEMLAAREITRTLGMHGKENLVRAFGAREIASGFMTLSVDKQAGLASRIAGDVLDIGTLATAIHPGNCKRDNALLALVMVAGITFLDFIALGANATRHSSRRGRGRDYSDRSGFPNGVDASRGAARKQAEDTRPTSKNSPAEKTFPAAR